MQGLRRARPIRLSALARGVSVALLVSASSGAEPSAFWDRVRDPKIESAERALADGLETRVPQPGGFDSSELSQFGRMHAFEAAMALQLKGAEALPSADLLYFLGDALVDSDRGLDEDARRILRKAIAAAPDSPLVSAAWFGIAVASNRLVDFESERAAYVEALRTTWDPDMQATILSNRAEASMSLGDLKGAREDYLSALARTTASGSEVFALAAWGLAVASARDDDLAEALKYAWKASSMRFPRYVSGRGFVLTQAIDLSSVFFTPPHEIFYYRALGDMAASAHGEGARERVAALGRAVEFWDEYLSLARPNGDRWIRNAEQLRKWCVRRLGELGVKPPSEKETSTKGSGSRSRRPPPTPARD
jgi:tetratricopeptide (TPR) repeat protein